jgi:hypothetical protein
MKGAVVLALAGSLIIAVPALGQETFVGTWKVVIEVPGMETEPTTWSVTDRDGQYGVVIEGGNAGMNSWLGAPASVQVTFDGTRFTITSAFPREGSDAFVIVNSGVIDGDTFKGTSKFGPLGEYRLTGTREGA